MEQKIDERLNAFIEERVKKEEPVSEDLEEAAKHYLYNNILYDDVYVGNPTDKDCIEMFKAGAEWQKTKDESVTKDLGEYIDELSKQFPEVSFAKLSRIAVRVAKWQKEQMMAKAIDCEVHQTNVAGIKLDSVEICSDGIMLDNTLYKEGDKVKVIVIKED